MANCPSMHSNSRFMFTGCSWFISGEKIFLNDLFPLKLSKDFPFRTCNEPYAVIDYGGSRAVGVRAPPSYEKVAWRPLVKNTGRLVPDCDHTTVLWLDRSPPLKMFKWLLHRCNNCCLWQTNNEISSTLFICWGVARLTPGRSCQNLAKNWQFALDNSWQFLIGPPLIW